MKLCYRGINYDYTPNTADTKESGVLGRYRGLDWRFRNLKRVPTPLPTLDLVYRGIRCRKSDVSLTPATVAVPLLFPVSSNLVNVMKNNVEQKARALMQSHHQFVRNRQQSLLSRSADQVGLANASENWGRIQGKIHPTFWADYDRSGATMS